MAESRIDIIMSAQDRAFEVLGQLQNELGGLAKKVAIVGAGLSAAAAIGALRWRAFAEPILIFMPRGGGIPLGVSSNGIAD